MSVKSMLSGKAEKDIKFQNILRDIINPRPVFITASGKKAFSSEYEELVPYTLSNPYYASLVGMGFDYLARFIIAKNLKNKNDKKLAYSNLVAGNGLKRLERMIDKKLYMTLNKKFDSGLGICECYIYNKNIDFSELLDFSAYLASLETIARSGMPPDDITKSLLDDTDVEIINDLKMLCNVFQDKFINSGIIKEYKDIIFNPRFGTVVSMCCGGADADIFIDGTLYDFKCTKSRGYSWIECAQIIAYYLLNIIDIRCGGFGMGLEEYSIEKLAFYRSRFGEIESIDANLLDENKVERGIEELRKLWGLKFI